jgi:lysyl-tRNA synthetase class 2
LSAKKQDKKAIKLKIKSENVAKFEPLLENLAQTGELNEVLKNRVEKAVQLMDLDVPLFPNGFEKDVDVSHIVATYADASAEELEPLKDAQRFRLAGRIVSLRVFGKAAFLHLQDSSGRMQVFVQKNDYPAEKFQAFKKLDIGDIIGVEGFLFRTKTDELTLHATSFELLTKSMRPLPEKYHGLKDVELRYRQRYVDLIVNPKVREIFQARTAIIAAMREFLNAKGFMEVETPMMQPIPGGATAKPFKTHHNALDMQLYMRIAPELYLKRLLVGGFERVYEINRNFRNEGISTQHNPEFTMLEFYWAYATFEDLMDLTEEMYARICMALHGEPKCEYQGQTIDLTPGTWARVGFVESLETIGGLSPDIYNDLDGARAHLKAKGEKVVEGVKLAKLQEKLFDLHVEPKLVQPTFIHSYPTDISPLSRRNDTDPTVVDRFELFMTCREMANAFSELNDPVDQRLRFDEQVAEKEAGDEEAHFMDEDYIRALEYGMPPAAGQGVGIDRLVMLLTDSPSIREVILFPLLRPETA